jgi:hypothetical protein
MNRTSTWRCSSPSCRAPLGEVQRDGSLALVGATVLITRRCDVSTVTCPACGARREWRDREHARKEYSGA